MYFVKTPQFIQKLFPNFTWSVPTLKKELYLTFDDGPSAEMTPWILNQLAQYNAKATFFCVGQEIEQHPEMLQAILDAGHVVGNHTYSHPNGWGANHVGYYHDVRKCAELVKTDLFRPPYGRLMPKQVQFLERHYQIVMWDVMSGDFDEKVDGAACYQNVVDNAKEGSIVVFHDNEKSKETLKYALPKVLEHFANQGFVFKDVNAALEDMNTNGKNFSSEADAIAA